MLSRTLLLSTIVLVATGCSSSSESTAPAVPAVSAASNSTSDASKTNDTRLIHLTKDSENMAALGYAQVEDRKLDTNVMVTGEVLANANTQTHVTTPVTGRVTSILVSTGDHIPEGKPLLIVRSTDIQQSESDLLQNEQQVRSDLKQALLQIDCDIPTAQAQIKLSETVYQRLKNLVEEKIASQADYQAAQTQWQKDQIALQTLKRKREATISLSTEKMKLVTGPAKTKLRLLGVSEAGIENVMKTQTVDPMVPVQSPEEGIVVERLVNVGELIDPSKPLFTIGEFNTVWLKADVFEKDIAALKLGQPIELEVDSFPGRVFRGKLDYVANQVDSDTRTLAVRAEVFNPQLLLKPKMFARMKILVGQHNVLAIPKTAVQDARSSKVVYVPTGADTFEERKVSLGAESGDYVEVLQGLKPGERIITNGSFDLRAAAVRSFG